MTTSSHPFFATCPRGIEQLLATELRDLGLTVSATTVAGVSGNASVRELYKACLHSRLANRIILMLAQTTGVNDADALYQAAIGVEWADHLPQGCGIRVDFHGQSDAIRHTRFGAQVIKDAIVDGMARAGLERPRVALNAPDLRIYAHLHHERLVLGLDLSGDSLHMRGYRLDGGKAPLKENLAAALLMRAGWPERAARGEVLLDPMCGSGTLLIEAAMMACNMAPNLWRPRFGFHGWKQHDDAQWRDLLALAREQATRGKSALRAAFVGQDADGRVVEAAGANARRAGVDGFITLTQGDVARLQAPAGETGLVITNPPYGERIGDVPALIPLYQALGERMRSAFSGWQLALFTGNPELGHRMGLKAHKQYAFKNGAIDCKLLLIDVYARTTVSASGLDTGQSGNSDTAPHSSTEPPRSIAHSEGAQMFANRLRKNKKRLNKWLKRTGIGCYRLYDADMPEYALAVDVYGSWVHVQEYAPPRSIDPKSAERRLHEALGVLPEVLDIASDKIFLKTRRRQSGKGQYQRQANSNQRLQVEEEGARLWVNLRDYLDTGLFLDHRPVRRMLRSLARGKRFLNLFCYTGTATVQAALGGARESISVDMSNTYLEWAADNFALNRLHLGKHTVAREDCFEWLKQDRSYFDVIFLDPPTFSNSSKMSNTLDIQRDHVRLIELCMARLAPSGTLLFSNNQRKFKLDPALAERFDVEDITRSTIDPDFERRPDVHKAYIIRKRP